MTKNLMDYDYDFQNDILFFYSKDDYDYEFSEVLDEKIVLDFSKDKIPVGLEISKASKVFKTKKPVLTNISGGNIDINIDENKIEISINLIVKIHLKLKNTGSINISGDNDLNIPNTQTEVGLAVS